MTSIPRLAAFALLLAAFVARAQTKPSVLMASVLAVVEGTPAFKTKDASGREVELANLLKKGTVVLYCYRGQWCPYCNEQLSQLPYSLQQLTAKGAQVVVVSRETRDNIGKTVAKTKATFAIVRDADFAIMRAYRTAFTVGDATAQKYQGFGLDLKQANGASQSVLPVPATYVIGRRGRIQYAYFNPAYRKRAAVKHVSQAL